MNERLNRLKQHYDPALAAKAPDWRDNWGNDDYVAPDVDLSQHPSITGDASWSQHSNHTGLDMRSASSLDADFGYAKDYKQEALPGQWLFYGRAE